MIPEPLVTIPLPCPEMVTGLLGLVVELPLWVREVPSSIPGSFIQ